MAARTLVNRVCLGLGAAGLAMGLTVAIPGQAFASTVTVRGTITCPASAPVSGIWLESGGGGSKFADWTPIPSATNVAQYSGTLTSATPTEVELRVGCGGRKEKWGSTDHAEKITLSGSAVLNPFCDGRGSCSWPSTGSTTSRNLGDPGYCTYGVFEQWHKKDGVYPSWSSADAKDFATKAAAAGYTISAQPIVNSIAVFPATRENSFGHVAWVTAVRISGGSAVFDVIEMNRGRILDKATGKTDAFGRYTTRSNLPTSSDLRFIVAP